MTNITTDDIPRGHATPVDPSVVRMADPFPWRCECCGKPADWNLLCVIGTEQKRNVRLCNSCFTLSRAGEVDVAKLSEFPQPVVCSECRQFEAEFDLALKADGALVTVPVCERCADVVAAKYGMVRNENGECEEVTIQ